MSALPLKEAARDMDVAEITLRRWIAQGCPVARRGGRGRGRATLVDVQAVRRWRDGGADAVLLAFASRVPDLLAEAVAEAHRQTQGPHKAATAGVLAATWYVCTTAMLDHLRARCPGVPEVDALPSEVQHLRKIAGK